MFATFNLENFPFVNVKFANGVKDDEDFDNFLKQWVALNGQETNYSLIFDTTNVGIMNPKYAYRAASFIKELKNAEKTFIDQTIIIVNHKYIRYLLDLVLNFQKPSAPVYIVDKHDIADNLYKKLKNKEEINLENVTVVYP